MLSSVTGALRPATAAAAAAAAAGRTFSAQAQQATASKGSHWWENDTLDCQGLYRTFINKIDQEGPQKPAALLALFDKCETEEDALRAVKACRRLRGQRGRRGINQALDQQVTMALVSAATRTGNLEAGLDALRRCHELQLTPVPAAFRTLAVAYAQRGEALGVLGAFDAMKDAGVRPNADTAFALVRGFVDCGVPEAARVAVAEFEDNGVRVPGAALRLLETKQPGASVAAADASQAEDEAAAPEAAAEQEAAADEAKEKPQ